MKLLLQTITEKEIQSALSSNAHALILLGAQGSGKLAVAKYLAEQFLSTSDLESSTGLKIMSPDKGSIGIESVRAILQFFRLKTTGHNAVRRVLIVEDAHSMTIEAQNAFLKILEEPPSDTRIILTIASGQLVLPTIRSRAQEILIRQPTKEKLQKYFSKQGKTPQEIQRAYLLSAGHIGIMSALFNNTDSNGIETYIDRARSLVSSTPYERLIKLDSFALNRDDTEFLLQAISRISDVAFSQSLLSQKTNLTPHWHKIRKNVLEKQSILKHSPNVKLLLTALCLEL